MKDDFGWEGLSFIDLINVLSFVLGIQNLELNESQIRSLDNHLKQQDDNLLAKIIEQNELLIEQNKELLKLLKEK